MIGASAGGVEALSTLVRGLPSDLAAGRVRCPAQVAAGAQRPAGDPQSRWLLLPALAARDGEPIHGGRIYVAVPGYHLIVEKGRIRVAHGPRENRMRRPIDVLFRSAAVAYGPRVVGIVLSGALDDGTAGRYAMGRRGGVAIVQQPSDALVPSMPQSALAYVDVDYTLPRCRFRRACTAHARAARGWEPVSRSRIFAHRAGASADEPPALKKGLPTGKPSANTCPECHGPLVGSARGQSSCCSVAARGTRTAPRRWRPGRASSPKKP